MNWSDEHQMERNDPNLKTFQRKIPHSVYFSYFFILYIQSAMEISLRFQCWVTMEMVPLTVITKKIKKQKDTLFRRVNPFLRFANTEKGKRKMRL